MVGEVPNKRSCLLSWANDGHSERTKSDSDFNVFTVEGSHAHVSRLEAWSDLARSEKKRRWKDRIGIPGRAKVQAKKPPQRSNQAREPEERLKQGRIDNGQDTQGQRSWWRELGRQRSPRRQTYPSTSLEHADTTVNCLKRQSECDPCLSAAHKRLPFLALKHAKLRFDILDTGFLQGNMAASPTAQHHRPQEPCLRTGHLHPVERYASTGWHRPPATQIQNS